MSGSVTSVVGGIEITVLKLRRGIISAYYDVAPFGIIVMEAAQIVTIVATLVGIVAVLLGIAALMWQINNQSGRLESKIETQGRELRDEIRVQGNRIEAQGTRVSQAELDQARMNGVNSVILQQTHTHEATGDAD